MDTFWLSCLLQLQKLEPKLSLLWCSVVPDSVNAECHMILLLNLLRNIKRQIFSIFNYCSSSSDKIKIFALYWLTWGIAS